MLLLFLGLICFRSTLKTTQNQKTLDILVQEVRAIHSDFSSSAVTGNCTEFNKPEQWTILQLPVSSIVMVRHQFLCSFRCSQERDTIGHAGKRRRGVAVQRKEDRRKEERISRVRRRLCICVYI